MSPEIPKGNLGGTNASYKKDFAQPRRTNLVPEGHGKVSNQWGCKGKPDHQAAAGALRTQAKQEFPNDIIHSGTSIKSQTGINRRPDVWVEDVRTGQVRKVYEAGRTNKDGSFASRERAKQAQYNAAGIANEFREVI